MHAGSRLAVITLVAFAAPAWAADFPSRAVKIVVPYPISGPTDIRGTSRTTKTYRLMAAHAPPPVSDILARMVEHGIASGTRHKVLLERQPGGVTTRGASSVARSQADGHTLLLASNATMAINPHYFHGVEYDAARDFVLVAPLAAMPFVLLVGSAVPADSVAKLAGWLKARPGEINVSSSGDGSLGHLAGELFRRITGVDIVHVSYNGGMAALNGLATGQVSLMFAALPLALPYLPSEYFRPLGIAGARRYELLPTLTTLAEAGLPGFEVEGWFGVFAPARTPPSAVVWLNEQISAQMTTEAARFRLLELGLDPVIGTLGQFATRIHTESERWGPVMRARRPGMRDEG